MALSTFTKAGCFDNDDINALNGNFSFWQTTGFPNVQLTEGGANNAITFNLLDPNGAYIPLTAGLRVVVKLAHSLQAGANTAAVNGGSTKAIKSHYNPASDIGTAYVSGALLDVMFDGTQWQDMSQ